MLPKLSFNVNDSGKLEVCAIISQSKLSQNPIIEIGYRKSLQNSPRKNIKLNCHCLTWANRSPKKLITKTGTSESANFFFVLPVEYLGRLRRGASFFMFWLFRAFVLEVFHKVRKIYV